MTQSLRKLEFKSEVGIKSGFTREDMKRIIREGLGVYKTDEIDLGYSLSTHCYRVYFKRWEVALYPPFHKKSLRLQPSRRVSHRRAEGSHERRELQ